MRNALPLLTAALVAAACASHENRTEAPAATAPTSLAKAPPSASQASPATQSPIAASPLHDPSNILAKRSIYFDFDSNEVKDQDRPVVQAHARYIASRGQAKVRIEGNCDERGSREYNLALGQRRAESEKRMMTVLGVPAARIETVSYGEEKPVAPGHDEKSWEQNRRADIRYLAE